MSYILIHRRLRDHWLWTEKPFSWGQAWIDLLMRATVKDCKDTFRGEVIEKHRGEVHCSMAYLAEKWGWHRQTVKRFLARLERDNMVTLNVTKRNTVITIENYDFWQNGANHYAPSDVTSDAPSNAPSGATSGAPSDATQRKKSKEVLKKSKEIFIPPTVAEVKAYCTERGNSIDAEAFVAFYESKGWMIGKNKMKSWKSAIITWERSRKSELPRSTGTEKEKSGTRKGVAIPKKWADDLAEFC